MAQRLFSAYRRFLPSRWNPLYTNSEYHGKIPILKLRNISTTSNDNDSKEGDTIAKKGDPFGMEYQDGESKLGPRSELPPKYIRDLVTGKALSEKAETDLSEEDIKILTMQSEEREAMFVKRLKDRWDEDENKELEFAEAIRKKAISLNTIGRKVKPSDDNASAPLTPSEFASFRKYMKKYKNMEITEDDIPVQSLEEQEKNSKYDSEDDLSWARDYFGENDNAWLDEIMPSDLAPQRRVNRREAVPIPKELIHHNNLGLLKRYTTPGGQIKNRMESRLGAKDQRKISKIVKRARALGLIPHVGQWRFEDHGSIRDPDIHEDREWEKELKERGLLGGPGSK